jgi:hypothetical protein
MLPRAHYKQCEVRFDIAASRFVAYDITHSLNVYHSIKMCTKYKKKKKLSFAQVAAHITRPFFEQIKHNKTINTGQNTI